MKILWICLALLFMPLNVFVLISWPLIAEQILVRTPRGDNLTIEINPQTSFAEVMEIARGAVSHFNMEQGDFSTFFIDFMMEEPGVKAIESSKRNYLQKVSPKEKEDIRYILKTLATNSWLQLLNAQSSLKKAGDRIDHIHPLRFLMCIFTDEELKASVHSIRDRNKIWHEFFDGLANSLEEESKRNNLRNEHIRDFASIINIDHSLIAPSIQEQQWQKTIDQLLLYLPRTGSPGRYSQ